MPGAHCSFPQCGASTSGTTLAGAHDWLVRHAEASGHDWERYGHMDGVYTQRQLHGMQTESLRRQRR